MVERNLKTELHDERLDVITQTLLDLKAESVLDLGCGTGQLLQRLVKQPQFKSIVGVDVCGHSLWHAREVLEPYLGDAGRKLSVIAGSYDDPKLEVTGFDACTMVETIEHVAPGNLSRVERAVFACYRPGAVLMTTPNAGYNEVYGLSPHQRRASDHLFEWDCQKFGRWVNGVASRNGYSVTLRGIGEVVPGLGQPTQFAVFNQLARPQRARLVR